MRLTCRTSQWSPGCLTLEPRAQDATAAAALRRRLRRHLWQAPAGPGTAALPALPGARESLPAAALPGEVLKALADTLEAGPPVVVLTPEAASTERAPVRSELEMTVAKSVELLATCH